MVSHAFFKGYPLVGNLSPGKGFAANCLFPVQAGWRGRNFLSSFFRLKSQSSRHSLVPTPPGEDFLALIFLFPRARRLRDLLFFPASFLS